MTEPLVVRQARAFSAALLDAETKQFAEMGKRWLEMEQVLESEMMALAFEIEQMRLGGKTPSAGQVKRMERLRKLLGQVQEQTNQYAAYASDLVIARKIEIAGESWRAALESVYGKNSPKLAALFDQLPVKMFETMAGLMADGSELRDYLKAIYGDAVDGMTNALLRAVAQGWNPVKTARAMREGLGLGLERALNVARTEQLRAMREATRMAYRNSGVQYYKRLAAKSTRTCIACLLADGKIFPVDQPFQEHPQGRCGMVPVLDEMLEWETGREWFLKQGDVAQRKILGSGLYSRWKASGLGVDALLKFHNDDTWGGYWRPAKIVELGEA
jgi:SPP1 gp7 family putative phage head morphogenesis protein